MVATPATVSGAYVGTAGVSYPSWRGGFYPEKASPYELLGGFSERLPTVALNTTCNQVHAREPPYDDETLSAWAARFRPLLDEGTRIYCYFKHEDEPRAPLYAQRLLELLR